MALTGDAAKALEAVRSGNNPMTAVYGESGGTDPDSIISADEMTVNPDEYNSALDALAGSDDEGASDLDSLSQSDSDDEADGPNADGQDGKSQTSGSIEEILVSDEKGRRKIRVDFSDKEALKKYVRQAHGMRKFQAERDQARKQLQEKDSSYSDLRKKWDSIEKAYQDGGIEGLIGLIDGREAVDKYRQGLIDRYETRRNASPEELELLDSREREAARDRELERIRRENEEFKRSIEQEREAAEMRSLESQIHPVYEKYNFSGKLGDADDEALFNDMLWNSALKRLEPYEEQGLEITKELVDKAFGDTANAIRRRIRANADKRVARTVANKKKQAAEVAEKTVQRGVRNNDRVEEARGLIRDGNISGIFKNWGKYGSIFNGK